MRIGANELKSVIQVDSLCLLVQMVRPLAAIDLTCDLNLQKLGLTRRGWSPGSGVRRILHPNSDEDKDLKSS